MVFMNRSGVYINNQALQWTLTIPVTHGTNSNGWNSEVATFQALFEMYLGHHVQHLQHAEVIVLQQASQARLLHCSTVEPLLVATPEEQPTSL